MSFLPDHYEPPVSGNYMKLATGKNKFRILGPAIVGNEFWKTSDTDDTKRIPVRRRIGESIDARELETNQRGEKEKVKHFWAFPVWNYVGKSVQILEITQGTVREGITALLSDEDWGEPITGYDISVSKSGTGLDTTYTVTPSNKAPTATEIIAIYKSTTINLDALFSGEDPFNTAATKPTQVATPSTSNMATDARMAAFKKFKDQFPPGTTKEEMVPKWMELIAKVCPGKKQSEVDSLGWIAVQRHLEGYSGEPVGAAAGAGIPEDDIPFAANVL